MKRASGSRTGAAGTSWACSSSSASFLRRPRPEREHPNHDRCSYELNGSQQGAGAPRDWYNHGVADEGHSIFAPDFVAYMPGQPPMDRVTFEHFVSGVTDGMPGYTYEIHDQIAQDDLVVNRITWRGVHSGFLASVPATDRSIELRGINVFRVKNGRVVEQWAQLDMLGLLQQIGAIPGNGFLAAYGHHRTQLWHRQIELDHQRDRSRPRWHQRTALLPIPLP